MGTVQHCENELYTTRLSEIVAGSRASRDSIKFLASRSADEADWSELISRMHE